MDEKSTQQQPSGFPRDWTDEERETYFVENKNLLHKAIQSYRNQISYDDLEQEASLAWWKAYASYDPTRGVKLTTYIYRAIKNQINMLLRASASDKRTASIISYDASIIGSDGKHLSGVDNYDASKTDGLHTPEQALEDHVITKEIAGVAMKLINTLLTNTEREAFMLYVSGKTQAAIGEEIGQSQAQISNTLKMVRCKLIHELRQAGFDR